VGRSERTPARWLGPSSQHDRAFQVVGKPVVNEDVFDQAHAKGRAAEGRSGRSRCRWWPLPAEISAASLYGRGRTLDTYVEAAPFGPVGRFNGQNILLAELVDQG
jgi:hypothetical protein